jgi:uncharacterized membrane protein
METALLPILLRWLHFGAGIVWIGHNYVNVVLNPRFVPPPFAEMSGDSNAELQARSRREHAIFRYSSLVAWGTGLWMLLDKGWLRDALLLQGHTAVIGTGTWIGTVMMLNVWLVLWPHQKKVLGFVAAAPEERARCARITFLSARVNTMLSVPLLFLMGAHQHGAAIFY